MGLLKVPLIRWPERHRTSSGIGGNGAAARSASTALAPSALSSADTIETLEADPATSRWKRSVTLRPASTPGGSTQRSYVRRRTSSRYERTAGCSRQDLVGC